MKLLALLPLLSVVLAAPTRELTSNQWNEIQSGFFENVKSLSTWTWGKAEQAVEEMMMPITTSDDDEDRSVWEILKGDPHSFSRLVKIIEFEQTTIKYLDDKDLKFTFFAPNNDALKPPRHGRHDDDDDDDSVLAKLMHEPSLASVSALLERSPALAITNDDDDDHDKRRKEIFRFIVGKVLKYHGIAHPYTARELAQNSTFATILKADDGSFAGLHRRIKVEKTIVPPSIKLNFYAKLLVTDIKAANGIMHTLDAPLLPPPSILDTLYLIPDKLSTLTSSLQKVGGAKYLDYSYDPVHSEPGKPRFHGVGLVSLFAPTNDAFKAIPLNLKLYLFSPFGEKALAKLLMYHSVPDTLINTEFVYTKKHGHHNSFSDAIEEAEFFDDASFHKEFEVKTALPNATLKIEIDKKQVVPIEGATKITLKVNGQEVPVFDVQARNGAWHAIDHLLIPPHHHEDHHHDHDHHDHPHSPGHDHPHGPEHEHNQNNLQVVKYDAWANWEKWLPVWADEE